MKYGIDVSKWDGMIDWSKVKGAGIEYAVLKVIQGNNTTEEAFERNYRGCASNGIPIGVYHFVYAADIARAEKEGEAIAVALKGRPVPYKVWLDMEFKPLKRFKKSTLTRIIDTEAEIVRKAGYEVGIYCSRSWYGSILDSAKLKKKYPFWIAGYGTNDGTLQPKYSPEAYSEMWQYTSRGKVDGIAANVDLDVMFTNTDAAGNAANSIYHIVRAGEVLSRIAAANKTTVSALMALNPKIEDANKIYVGQKIKLR